MLRRLREGALGNGSTYTEELDVAEPAAIRYYLRPFLVHLAESIDGSPRALDDGMPFFLFAHVRSILEHRGSHTFTESQLRAISALVSEGQKVLLTLPEGIWIEDVSKQARDLREILQRA